MHIDRTLDRLAATIAEDGFTPDVEWEVGAVTDRARRLGVVPVATGVLADRAQPVVARARAFGRVAVALALAPPSAHPLPLPRRVAAATA